MLTYSAGATLYLGYVAIAGGGPLLWPAVVLHATLTVLLIRTLTSSNQANR